MKKLKLLLIVSLFSTLLTAQNKYLDSLQNWLLVHQEQDTQRVMNTHRLSYRLSEINPSKAWRYAKESEVLATKIGFTKGICLSNINYAILETNEGNFKSSAEYYLKAIQYAEKINYTRGISISYNNIGDNYFKLKEYNKVLEYSEKALALNKKINESRGQAINLEQIGQVYFAKKEYDKAFKYWNESIQLANESGDPNINTQLIIDIAKYYLEKNQPDKAFTYLKTADSIAAASNEILLQVLTYKAFATGFQKKKQDDSTILYLQKALKSTQTLENKTEECEIYSLIAAHFENIKQYDSAFHYLRKHKILSDTVLSDKNFAHLAFIQTQYETELKEKENQQLRSIQLSQNRKISEKNALLIASAIALLLALLSTILLYRSFQNKKQQLILEEEKKLSEYNQQFAELEIKSLRSQMNPHFLFNSLNSIRNYIIKNESQIASNYLANFASLMRKILDASQQSKISLQEEIEMLKLYLDLELMRFSNRFTYSFHIDEAIVHEDFDIPSMVIQPFVENAIWHGLLNKESDAHLTINFKEIVDNDYEILCEVIDNGIGRKQSQQFKNNLKKHQSKGIDITKERLKRLSKIPQNEPILIIDLEDEDGNAKGTMVQIHLPIL
ncbi:MAG TPA: histidine kinase [Chitinophagaceae bacterium]|jgi:hypothetical protein|nr:histidine kinase [Bacteroidota bacterium]MBK9300348.1 histidine kinase [Bacteroidota bacterium]HMT35197.1 histidine kinase [Chitinophagaceae bacterium]